MEIIKGCPKHSEAEAPCALQHDAQYRTAPSVLPIGGSMSSPTLPLSVRRELWARIWQQLLQPPTTTERANANREAH